MTATAQAFGRTADAIESRQYQDRLVTELESLLADHDYAYLEAPTGTGKTAVLGKIANNLALGDVYYLANTIDLIEQAKRSITELAKAGHAGDIERWHFMTWLKYVSSVKSGVIDPHQQKLTLVDECHIGGARSYGKETKTCFPIIRETSTKTIWSSATPWMLDENLMGARANHTAFYSYGEAFSDGYINETDLVRVDCSLDLELKLSEEIKQVRDAYRQESSRLTITSGNADRCFEQLTEEVRSILDRGLKPTDIPSLVSHRYRLMAQLYRATHSGQKAIFWLPNRTHARNCAKFINEIFDDPHYALAVTGEKPARYREGTTSDGFQSWRDPEGSTKVACVVFRLREGFDYPELAVGFDCAWNPYNYRNAIQKIGRLIRTNAEKPRSTYYYAVDAISIAAARSRLFNQAFLGPLTSTYASEIELTFEKDAMLDASEMKALTGRTGQGRQSRPATTDISIAHLEVRTARTPLFDVTEARGSTEQSRLSLSRMFTSEIDNQTQLLIEDILAGREQLKLYGKLSSAQTRLKLWVSPSSPLFRPGLRKRLIASGHLKPRAKFISDANEKLEALVSGIEAGAPRPKSPHPDFKWLEKYYNPSCRAYRPDIRERLIRCGALKPIVRQSSDDDRLGALIEVALKKGHFPASNSADYAYISSFISPSSPRYDASLRKKLETAGIVKETTSERLERIVRECLEAGALPHGRSKDRGFLNGYISKSQPKYDAVVRAKLNHLLNVKTPRDRPGRARAIELIEKAIAEGKLPSTYSRERRTINCYITPSQRYFEPALREKVEHLFKKRSESEAKDEASALIDRAIDTNFFPIHGSSERKLIDRYICPSSPRFDQEMRDKVEHLIQEPLALKR